MKKWIAFITECVEHIWCAFNLQGDKIIQDKGLKCILLSVWDV